VKRSEEKLFFAGKTLPGNSWSGSREKEKSDVNEKVREMERKVIIPTTPCPRSRGTPLTDMAAPRIDDASRRRASSTKTT